MTYPLVSSVLFTPMSLERFGSTAVFFLTKLCLYGSSTRWLNCTSEQRARSQEKCGKFPVTKTTNKTKQKEKAQFWFLSFWMRRPRSVAGNRCAAGGSVTQHGCTNRLSCTDGRHVRNAWQGFIQIDYINFVAISSTSPCACARWKRRIFFLCLTLRFHGRLT